MKELDVARHAAAIAGEITARYFRDGVTARVKGDQGLVTDADTESEQAIVDVIRDAFPSHAVLAEEGHRAEADAEHLWVVDPLDGTNNFVHGIPHFAVSIAYYNAGTPVCGVIHDPVNDRWYTATRGGGAFHGDRPVRVSQTAQLEACLVGVGFYYDRGAMMEATLLAIRDLFRNGIRGIRRFGTASLDLCQVGLGTFGAFFEYELSPWDFAAGRLFVEEAGGRVTDCRGNAIPLASTTVLATNGRVHEQMLAVVGGYWPARSP